MLDWSAIDTVLLDMDGTLLDLHFDNHFWLVHLPQRYADLHKIPQEQARQELMQRIDTHRGTLNWYCLDYWSQELGIDIPQLKEEVCNRIRYRPHVQTFLSHLRAAGLRTVIVTNAHRKSVKLKLAITGLDQGVDRIISSHDFGYPKEDQAFWHALQATEPFNPARTLLIDDSLAVLESAQHYGIQHLLAVLAPDSQQPPHPPGAFPGLHHFDELPTPAQRAARTVETEHPLGEPPRSCV